MLKHLRLYASLTFVPLLPLTASAAVTINAGFLGLNTTSGAINDVWAGSPDANSVFDHWTGSTTPLADPYSWHTTGVMPSRSGSATATYKAAPAWVASTTTIASAPGSGLPVNLMYYAPTKPVGVIFYFHGGGGSASTFYTKVETLSFAREAVLAGYVVAALDSNDRSTGSWAELYDASNIDVQNVQKSINYLVSQKLITTSTPKYSAGMSNGGSFSPKPAYFLGFKGNAIWCAGGTPSEIFRSTTVPTIWSLAQKDDLYNHTTFLENSTRNQEHLAERGIAANLQPEHLPSPVYPQRFMRISGILLSDSQTIFDLLKNGGYLDGKNYLLQDPETSNWPSLLPKTLQKYQRAITDQLACCYTAHEFFSEYDHNVIAFFNAHR